MIDNYKVNLMQICFLYQVLKLIHTDLTIQKFNLIDLQQLSNFYSNTSRDRPI